MNRCLALLATVAFVVVVLGDDTPARAGGGRPSIGNFRPRAPSATVNPSTRVYRPRPYGAYYYRRPPTTYYPYYVVPRPYPYYNPNYYRPNYYRPNYYRPNYYRYPVPYGTYLH